MDGWIKLHRKLIEWEWYQDINVKVLFIHCLLKSNHLPCNWKGIEIKSGQFFTSIKHLAIENNLTEKQIRIALSKLEKTKEIEQKGSSNGTMITVCKYDEYQFFEKQEGKRRANGGQTEGKQRATNKNDKKEKKEKNIYGILQNIFLTNDEFERLKNDFPFEYLKAIDYLSYYKIEKAYKTNNDNLTLRRWVFDALKKTNKQQSLSPQPPAR